MARDVAADSGWSAAAVGQALEQDAHTIGQWAQAFSEGDPRRWFLNRPVVPPALDVEQRAELKSAVQQLPSLTGIGLSNWNWKGVRQFVADRIGLALSRSPPLADLNYLHRLGFLLKRPKKRLFKADPVRGSFRGTVCGADGDGATDGDQGILC